MSESKNESEMARGEAKSVWVGLNWGSFQLALFISMKDAGIGRVRQDATPCLSE